MARDLVRLGRLGALSEPQFRRYFIGQATSYLGDGLLPVAISFAVLDLTGSASDLGFVLAARMVPVVAFLLVGGVWADRLPRHLVMLASDAGRGGVQTALAVLLLTGTAELWHLLALQAVYGVAEAFWRPASTGLLPTIVSPGRLHQANAIMSVTVNGAYIVGPAAAGLLVATFGAGPAIAIDAGTFAVSTVALLFLRVPRAADRAERMPFVTELRAGWSEFVARSWLWATVAVGSLYLLLVVAPIMVLGPVVADRELGGAGAWGAIAAGIGLGTLVGAAAAGRVRPRRPILAVAVLLAGPALTALALAFAVPVALAAALGFVAGATEGFLEVVWITALQERIPLGSLSRVSAYDTLGSFVFMPVGFAVAGPAADAFGTRETLLAVAAFALFLPLLLAAVPGVRSVRRLEPRTAPAP
ncbi:MAG: MFS transporter [Thermoleophilia bacterium]|nr:MFS transporter [Thermoleophilia bacterium]